MRPFGDKIATWLLDHLDSASTMLIIMGIIGTITSSIAQQIGIKANKSLPDDKKAYLINQEQKDCMLSAGLTWTTGISSKKLINALTSKGYLLNNRVINETNKIAMEHGLTPKQLAQSGFFKIAKNNVKELNISQYPHALRNFTKCQEGLNVISAVVTAILTTNLLVPILRNKLAKQPPSNNINPVIQPNLSYKLPLGKIPPRDMYTVNPLKI